MLVAVLAVACSSSSPTAPQPAELLLGASPNPVQARPSSRVDASGRPFDWRASFRVSVSEGAGVDARISSTTAVVREASGGIVVGTPDQSEDVVVSVNASSSRLPAFGTVNIEFDVDYRFRSGRREGLIEVTVSARETDDNDDDAFAESESITVTVL